VMTPYRAVPRRQLPGSPFNVPVNVVPADTYEVADLVTHDKYGLGTVTGVEEGIAVLVNFGSHERRLSTPCAKLTKL
jgi:D-aminopeptidase